MYGVVVCPLSYCSERPEHQGYVRITCSSDKEVLEELNMKFVARFMTPL